MSAPQPRLRPMLTVDVHPSGLRRQPGHGGLGRPRLRHCRHARWTTLSEATFVLPPTPQARARGADYRVRAFTLDGAEDPVTGSLNACLAHWLQQQNLLRTPYQARQGCCVGRDGWVGIARDVSQQLWVPGHSVACITGQVWL